MHIRVDSALPCWTDVPAGIRGPVVSAFPGHYVFCADCHQSGRVLGACNRALEFRLSVLFPKKRNITLTWPKTGMIQNFEPYTLVNCCFNKYPLIWRIVQMYLNRFRLNVTRSLMSYKAHLVSLGFKAELDHVQQNPTYGIFFKRYLMRDIPKRVHLNEILHTGFAPQKKVRTWFHGC